LKLVKLFGGGSSLVRVGAVIGSTAGESKQPKVSEELSMSLSSDDSKIILRGGLYRLLRGGILILDSAFDSCFSSIWIFSFLTGVRSSWCRSFFVEFVNDGLARPDGVLQVVALSFRRRSVSRGLDLFLVTDLTLDLRVVDFSGFRSIFSSVDTDISAKEPRLPPDVVIKLLLLFLERTDRLLSATAFDVLNSLTDFSGVPKIAKRPPPEEFIRDDLLDMIGWNVIGDGTRNSGCLSSNFPPNESLSTIGLRSSQNDTVGNMGRLDVTSWTKFAYKYEDRSR
jgi:hypothetical protein